MNIPLYCEEKDLVIVKRQDVEDLESENEILRNETGSTDDLEYDLQEKTREIEYLERKLANINSPRLSLIPLGSSWEVRQDSRPVSQFSCWQDGQEFIDKVENIWNNRD